MFYKPMGTGKDIPVNASSEKQHGHKNPEKFLRLQSRERKLPGFLPMNNIAGFCI